MDGDSIERLPYESKCRENGECGLLEKASEVANRILEEIGTLAGTTSCKSVQLVRLRQWAKDNNCWFQENKSFGDFFDRGSENEAYLSNDGTEIVKLNDFRYSDDNLTPFFERIKAHNIYFPDCPYRLLGFAENREGNICAVLAQPYIDDARLATKEEIHEEFLRLGFRSEDNGAYYTNNQHDIFDAVDGNVLVGGDGHLYFIDTIIFPSETGGYDTYRSLSPHFSKK